MKNKLIKVCGMREGQNIREVEQLGVNMIGLIFYPQSPRCVCKAPDYLPQQAMRIGVFVDENREYVQVIANRFALDYVQLHGNESPEYCLVLQLSGLKVIKNFSIATEKDLEHTEQYEGLCDYFLFDTKCDTFGGSGKQFDWHILHYYKGKTPFILSGGISLYSIQTLKSFNHPRLAGYDINSRFETEPGKKDVKRVATFVKQIKDYEQNKSTIQQQ